MKLQGRNLSLRMKGEDVQLLQQELQQLGFSIPREETDERRFGGLTRQAVLAFQRQHSLEPTGAIVMN